MGLDCDVQQDKADKVFYSQNPFLECDNKGKKVCKADGSLL